MNWITKRNVDWLLAILIVLWVCLTIILIFRFTSEFKSHARLPNIQGVEITFEDKPKVLKRIIQCESGGDRFAQNPTSSALGIFQIIDSTELFCERHLGIEIDRTSVNDSWLCAIFLYERYGTEHWVCK